MQKGIIAREIRWVRLQLKNTGISSPTRMKLIKYGKKLQKEYLECCHNEEGKVD